MIRNVSKVHNEFRLFGIKFFSNDYTVTELEETDEFEEVQILPSTSNRMTKRKEQIMFLEKLYRQGNNNIDDIPF